MIDFIILGAQKSATSALQDSLRAHPRIYMPPGESPFFEDPDFSNEVWLDFGEGLNSDVVKGIKRPDYLCTDLSRTRIKQVLPESKFIVVLREPVSRAISSYCYMVRHAHLPAKPINKGMVDCVNAYNNGENSRAASVISYGLYGEHLKQWFNLYGKEKFLILSQEDVSNRLPQVLNLCLNHLGIYEDDNYNYDVKVKKSNMGLYDTELLKIARFVSIIKTKRLIGSERRVPRNIIANSAGFFLNKTIDFIAKIKGQRREKLCDVLQIELENIYKKDLELLIKELPLINLNWLAKYQD